MLYSLKRIQSYLPLGHVSCIKVTILKGSIYKSDLWCKQYRQGWPSSVRGNVPTRIYTTWPSATGHRLHGEWLELGLFIGQPSFSGRDRCLRNPQSRKSKAGKRPEYRSAEPASRNPSGLWKLRRDAKAVALTTWVVSPLGVA